MKKYGLLALLFATVAYAATTYTTNYQLAKPGNGDKNYGELVRDNFDTIDTQMKLNADSVSNHIADTVDAHDATAISTAPGAFVCTTSTTVQQYLDCLDGILDPGISGVVLIAGAQTITGAKTFSALTNFSAGITATTATLSSSLTLTPIVSAPILSTTAGGVVQATTFTAIDPLTTKGDLLVQDATTSTRVPVGTNGQQIYADSTDAEGIVWGNPNPRWRKLTYAFGDFSTAGTTFSITAFSLAAKEGVSDVVIKHNTAFSGGTIAAYTVEVGQSGDTDEYAVGFDVFQATSNTLSQATQTLDVPNFSTTTDVVVTATSTGGNLNAATAGSVDIYIRTFVLP